MTKALLLIDIQNGFCPGGNLPVAEGDKIVPVDIHDVEGKKVFTARITMNVKLS